MDVLFSRKRSASISARHKEQSDRAKGKNVAPPADASASASDQPPVPDTRPATLKKSATTGGGFSEKRAGKRKEAVDAAFGVGGAGGQGSRQTGPRVSEKAPSLNIDIRNSLILPGLSQRFSVLLPKLSTAPETSLRSLLASQRERSDGPSLTLEEEEMLFEEMRAGQGGAGDDWDGQPPVSSSSAASAWKSHSQEYLNRSNLSASASSPSILSLSSDGTVTATDRYTGSANNMSPPPTSSSFSSFQTFGGSGSTSRAQPRSYGFSGGSGMRDDTYLRKVASTKNPNGSVSSRKSNRSADGTSPPAQVASLPVPGSGPPASTDQTAGNGVSDLSASTTSNRAFPPLPDTPIPVADAKPDGTFAKRDKRQSHLAALSTSQRKRISHALLEIDHELRRDGKATQISKPPIQEEEEVLEPEPKTEPDPQDADEAFDTGHQRRPSYPDSESSFQSQYSAPFPYGVSPAKSERPAVEQPSPSARLPPSPRSHNLKAQVEGAPEDIPPLNLARNLSSRATPHPAPIITPARGPLRHGASPSTSSPSAVSPVPGYVPGQPRPIGSTHRSDGSVSSRSATPTNQNTTAPSSAQSSIAGKGHMRAGSTPTHQPSAITPRTSSLGRSRSVNQTSETRDDDASPSKVQPGQTHARLLIDREPPNSRRPSSHLSITSPPIIEEESEESPELSEDDSLRRQPTPDIRVIPQRKEMSSNDPRAHIQQAGDALGWSLQPGTGGASRVVSEQGFIGGSTESATPSSALLHEAHMANMTADSWKRNLRQADSRQSLASDYAADESGDVNWEDLFTSSQAPSSDGETLHTPATAALSDTLRKLSGLGQEDLAVLQDKLVQKARAERQAIRDDSPVMPYSPAMQQSAALPKRSASLARGQSPMPQSNLSPELPPSAWRRPSHDLASPVATVQPAPPKSLAGLFTPPSTANPPTPSLSESRGLPRSAAMESASSGQTPSAEGHDETVLTPLSDPHGHHMVHVRQGSKAPLDEDPEVRRDFEARIAAATAALNRTPSLGGNKLERKPTKKGAVVNISSPKLLSSSSNVTGTPLTPPEPDPAMKKALDKSSGSGKKMSGKWRKLGFRRGPSLGGQSQQSATTDEPTPPTPPIGSIPPPLGATPTTEKKLEEAINLAPGTGISPDLDNFKFPPIAGRVPKNPALRNRPISPPMPYLPSMQQVSSPQVDFTTPTPSSTVQRERAVMPDQPAPTPTQTSHSHSSSSDSAVAKFIESGRALGLNQAQLDQMLHANGMLDRSATTASSRSYQSTAATTHSQPPSGHSHKGSIPQSAPPQVSTHPQAHSRKPSGSQPHEPELKSKGGLLRAFSKSKGKSKGRDTPETDRTKPIEPVPSRNKVVRRTILVSTEPLTPTMPKSPSAITDSPDTNRSAPGRKQSIKRKPLNLSREDQALVSNSPPPSGHRRTFSAGTAYSNMSDAVSDSNQPANKGLGFLHPLGTSSRSMTGGASGSLTGISETPSDRLSTDSRRRSSTGGSLYDLYGDDSTGNDEQEFLKPEGTPDRRPSDQTSGRSGRAVSQAVEICEYEDGRLVWSVVDGLRDEDEGPEIDYSLSNHSRNDSFTSTGSSQNDTTAARPQRGHFNTPALNLRHRDRGPAQPRPETFVYRAATNDVADLIDHLSRDLDASRGRIDISQLAPYSGSGDGSTAQSSPFPYSAAGPSEGTPTAQASPDSRFADPPSPEPTTARQQYRSPAPPPIFAPPATAHVPAGGFSPKRQMMLRQGFGAHRANLASQGGTVAKGSSSPSGVSFASSQSGGPQRTVEERLQNLLDRLKIQNDRDEAAANANANKGQRGA